MNVTPTPPDAGLTQASLFSNPQAGASPTADLMSGGAAADPFLALLDELSLAASTASVAAQATNGIPDLTASPTASSLTPTMPPAHPDKQAVGSSGAAPGSQAASPQSASGAQNSKQANLESATGKKSPALLLFDPFLSVTQILINKLSFGFNLPPESFGAVPANLATNDGPGSQTPLVKENPQQIAIPQEISFAAHLSLPTAAEGQIRADSLLVPATASIQAIGDQGKLPELVELIQTIGIARGSQQVAPQDQSAPTSLYRQDSNLPEPTLVAVSLADAAGNDRQPDAGSPDRGSRDSGGGGANTGDSRISLAGAQTFMTALDNEQHPLARDAAAQSNLLAFSTGGGIRPQPGAHERAEAGKPASQPAPDTAQTSTLSESSTRFQPAREIALRLDSSGASPVSLQLVERGGDVRIAVRTHDAGLSHDLQTNLNDLIVALKQDGIDAETWVPPHLDFRGSEDRGAESNGGNSQQGGSSDQKGSGGRDGQRRERRPQWVDRLESGFVSHLGI